MTISSAKVQETRVDLGQMWDTALKELKLQMPQATFDAWLNGTALLSTNDGVYLIEVKSAEAKDWLENRLCVIVQRTLSSLVGENVVPQFIVHEIGSVSSTSNGSGVQTLSDDLTLSNNMIIEDGPTSAGENLALGVDFEKLWYDKGGTGYDRIPKYCAKFWRAYLNRLNPKCFGLWEYLQTADSRKVNAANFTYWTPVKKYRVRALARILGGAPSTISGGFRQCPVFNAALAEGRELESCCGNYHPVRMKVSKYGNPQCLHWVPGAFERLFQEGLLAIRVTGDTPRSTFHHLQVWRLLPLLTPYQVQQLHDVEQEAHEQWLDKNAYKGDFSLEQWSTITEKTLMPLLPSYEAGLDVLDDYQPNPLLDSMESNNR